MNVLKMQLGRNSDVMWYLLNLIRRQTQLPKCAYTTTMVVDLLDSDVLQKQRDKMKSSNCVLPGVGMQRFIKVETKNSDISKMTDEELDKTIQTLVSKNRDKEIEQMVIECLAARRMLSDIVLKTMLKHYSYTGKPDMINLLQRYCVKILPNMFRRNGEFTHYMAKAQCYKGNSEKGLSLLKEGYMRNDKLRSFYKVIFRELIQDSVLNRSEASLVVFKRYVLEFSDSLEEHYPLVCMWHICWLSSWYSDQMLSDELWNSSEKLHEIVGEKVTALSISALKADYNEDAVVRLLQNLLKTKMMDEYLKVLQVLFSYKLKCRDLRGCTEIIRNCEVLGLTLPASQQGRFIKMLISGTENQPPDKPTSKNFTLKF